jgi:hypothetical protein
MTSSRMMLCLSLLGLLLNGTHSQGQPQAASGSVITYTYGFTLPVYVVRLPDAASSCHGSVDSLPRMDYTYDASGRPIESQRLCGDAVVSRTEYVYDSTPFYDSSRLLAVQVYEYEKGRLVSATLYQYDLDKKIRNVRNMNTMRYFDSEYPYLFRPIQIQFAGASQSR